MTKKKEKKAETEKKIEWVYACDVHYENEAGLYSAKLYQDKAGKDLKVELGDMIRRRRVRG